MIYQFPSLRSTKIKFGKTVLREWGKNKQSHTLLRSITGLIIVEGNLALFIKHTHMLRVGFLNLDTADILGQIIRCWECCPVQVECLVPTVAPSY